MGSYIYAVRKPTVKLKQVNDSEQLEVRLARFVCRADCADGFERQLTTAETNYHKAGVATHIVLGDDLKDLNGQMVYEYGCGSGLLNDDHDLGYAHPVIGIILGKPRAWYLETRKEVIEKIHRQNQFQGMKKGLRFIGEFGNDVNAYEEFLHKKDKEAQANGEPIYFQGYSVN